MSQITQVEEKQNNEAQFELMLQAANPPLYKIWLTLRDTGINPLVVPAVVNALYEVAYVTGHGNVTIFISDHKITDIEPKPRMKLNIDAILKELPF